MHIFNSYTINSSIYIHYFLPANVTDLGAAEAT